MTPASSQPRAIPSPTAGGIRQILAVVDIDTPVEPLVRRAVAESSAHAVPLHVIVLYPRIPFTTDPALAARIARRLGHEQRRMVAAVTDAAQNCGLGAFELRLVPLSRIPLMSRLGQVRRTVAAQLRQQPSSLLVAAEHLNSGAGPNPVAPEPGPSADDLQHFERSSA
jgi:hypothetical protein